MNESANIETVQRLYADFGRGDIPALLAALDPAVDWINAGPDTIPYAGTRHGLAQVREFFATLEASVEVQTFEPREFLAQGDRVVVLGGWTGRAKATGRAFASEWAMAWTVKNGQVVSFRAYEDTHAIATAFAGSSGNALAFGTAGIRSDPSGKEAWRTTCWTPSGGWRRNRKPSGRR